MDKVKVFLGYLKKYHFWLLCGLAMLLSLIGWMKGRNTLSAEYDANKSTITGKFTSLDAIRNTEFPPNEQWKEGISKLSQEERTIVGNAWEKVFKEQKATLKWPDFLGPEFIKWIDTHPPTDTIPAQYCRIYQNYIQKEFPRLLEIVDAAPASNDKRTDAPAADATRIYKVVWDSSSQAEIQKRLEMLEEPTSLEVRVAQEDLWVYGALLNIIRATNEGAQYTSRVKKITRMLIGRDAAEEYAKGMKGGHIERLAAAGGGDAGAEPDPAALVAPPEPTEPGAATKPAPDEGRYVDHKEGTKVPPDEARARQFKCMPIYMKLEIDQREITRLLTECANSRLPVEVRQLRINPENTAKSRSATSPSTPGSNKPGTETSVESMDVTIEVNGIIYIYNPPDPAKLGAPGGEAAPATAAPATGG
jgi:hypothetical protein